jgi:hypothetical protein
MRVLGRFFGRWPAGLVVALLACQFFGTRKNIIGFPREVWLTALDAWQALELCFQRLVDGLFVDRQLTKQERNDLLAGFHDGGEQVLRLDGLLAAGLGHAHGLLHGLLCFDGKFVEVHNGIYNLKIIRFYSFRRKRRAKEREAAKKSDDETF